MENRFYTLSKKNQKIFQIKLGFLSLGIVLIFGLTLYVINMSLLPLVFLIIIGAISVIAPFFDVPALIEKGSLKYYSLFLIAEVKKNDTITIHGGTLFDYYFVFNANLNGKERTKLIISSYLKGIIKLINQENDSVKIKGTSYIINEKTANKIGLRKTKTDNIQKLILLFNYVNLLTSIYLAKRIVKFPNLNNIHTYEAEVKDIKKKEVYINQLISKLENTTKNKD